MGAALTLSPESWLGDIWDLLLVICHHVDGQCPV